MRKNHVNLLILISILIYILACFMPAYVEARNPPSNNWIAYAWTEYRDYPGFACLLDGILLPLGLMNGYWGTIVWIANAYYFSALFLFFSPIKRQWPIICTIMSIICVIISIIIGSTLMFFTLHYGDRDYYCWIESLLSGYYFWLLSFITLLIGLLSDNFSQTVKQWGSLIYCIGMIPIFTHIIVPTFDKGDNSIIFDEDSQCLVANKSLDALVIDDGTHMTFLKRIADSDSVIALKNIYSSFTPTDCESTPINLSNNIYEIYNATFVRVPQQKIRIEVSADGKAHSVPIPNEDGDNSFCFDMESQCLITSSYFDQLVIDYETHLYWLDRKGLKRNTIPINNLSSYFTESNDTILPLKGNHTYIINNLTHSGDVHSIKIYLNDSGIVDCVLQLPPKKNV